MTLKQQRPEEYRGYRTAGIRLAEEFAPELRSFREQSERSGLYAFHMFDKAHVTMLTEEGIIRHEIGAAILRALRDLEAEGAEEVRTRIGGGMHSGETYLIRKLGEDVGGWEHLGRSSGDLGAVGQRIQERDGLLESLEALSSLRSTLLDLALQHVETVLPGYFHWQHAQPITFAHYLVAMSEALGRDAARGQACYGRSNLSPAGAVILTGTSFPIRRERTAELLGFDGVHVNTLDAIQDADHVQECFAFLSMVAAHLTRLMEDVSVWAGTEFGYLDVADRFASGSSILMQMKTPTPPTQVKAALPAVVGGMMAAYLAAKGPTGMAGRGSGLENAFDTVTKMVRLLTPFMGSINVDAARAREEAARHYAGGTDLAAALVTERGLPWRTAHQICGILFRLCSERDVAPKDLTPALLDEAAVEYFGKPIGLSQHTISQALDPLRFVQARTLTGGPAPTETRRQVEVLQTQLGAGQGWLEARRKSLGEAARKLEWAIDAIIEKQQR